MGQPSSDLHFKLMFLTFKFRDFFRPRMDILKEVGIQPGFRVLDFGCGSGSYIPHLAALVGPSGEIYALDRHPMAIQTIQKVASKKGLKNVKPLQSDGSTGLPDSSLDAALLYDSFHEIDRPGEVLKELHRILKPGGILSFRDHHLKEEEFLPALTKENLFEFSRKGAKTYTFSKKI
jgi:ubiquinone/menaquinone biosynthesis C-methylase UbiE